MWTNIQLLKSGENSINNVIKANPPLIPPKRLERVTKSFALYDTKEVPNRRQTHNLANRLLHTINIVDKNTSDNGNIKPLENPLNLATAYYFSNYAKTAKKILESGINRRT